MENLGLIVLRANGNDIFFMLFFICVVVVLAYGIGCLGRKRKIGFGWAFAISLFLNPLIGLIVVLCSKEKIEFIDVDKNNSYENSGVYIVGYRGILFPWCFG